ncbi:MULTISPECIES: hypothetical protein [Paenibacillus]|uniref:DNA-binding protein n=1 Tax=Paenibacillus albilobatus TaxID=2716884 RepID=A0A919XF69_9BACL|nr:MULTISPECIES: hypothetical protein [Paenibacillus]GIO31066.1 hypothetical protein J2TS6_22070 [Paenibacillus albilobatus]
MGVEASATNTNVDTLVTMLRMAFSFENWDNLIILADELLDKVYGPYRDPSDQPKPVMEKPLVYYLGYCNLMKGVAYQKKKLYKEAMECIDQYRDLSLFSDGSESNQNIIEDFSFFAKANSYTVEILSGNTASIEEYALFIQQYPSETLPGLVTILECANKHDLDVDGIVSPLLVYIKKLNHADMNPTERSYYLAILYLFSIYHFKKNNYKEAIDFTIQSLIFSDKIDDDQHFKKSVALFEVYRSHATKHQRDTYAAVLKNYLMGVIEHEEGFSFNNDRNGSA